MHHCKPMNCFLVRKNVHKAAQHFFPQSAQSEEALQPCYNPHSGDGPSELRGVLDGKPQVSVVTASVCPLQTRGKNSRYSSLLASPFFLLLAFGIFAVIFLFLGHFETTNFLPDHCSSPPGLELEERRKAVQLSEPSSTVILLHREHQQPTSLRHGSGQADVTMATLLLLAEWKCSVLGRVGTFGDAAHLAAIGWKGE